MKKFLSLVLALVMTMSLVTISAGAKDFTDADKVNYDEAIAVLSAVKVIDGYTDGSFKPQTPLNRGQAAKIICNLVLGPTTAAELSATVAPFSDVPANNIFAGYITYCANEGIICGYGDGTFRPTASLTGYAFLKMLLGALGYDAEIEGYNNPGSFGIQVAKQAIGIGLNKGLKDTFNGNKTVTREEACLYALNTLKATMVEYDQKIVANVNGAQVTVGTSVAQDVKWGVATLNDGHIKNDGFVQFAEKYFPKLELEVGNGIYGRPTNVWKLKKAEIGAFTSIEPTYVYTEDTDQDDVYKDLGKVVCDEKEYDWTVFVNGKEAEKTVVPVKGGKYWDYTGKGTVTEIYVNDDDETVTVCEINYYLGEVSKVKTDDDGEYINVTAMSDTKLNDKKFYVEGFEEEDLIAFTRDWNEDDEYVIGEVCELETVTGEVTRVEKDKDNDNTYLRVAGDKIPYSDHNYYDVTESTMKAVHPELAKDYIIYMDPNGYVLGFELAEKTVDQYLFVLDTHQSLSKQAKVLLADGTVEEIKIDDITADDKSNPTLNGLNGINNKVCTYTVDSKGVYDLEVVTGAVVEDTWTDKIADNGASEINNGRAYFTLANGTNVIVDKKTVFTDYDGETAYTGYAEIPSFEHASLAYVFKDKVAKIVFVLEGDKYDADSTYFVLSSTKHESLKYDGKFYREYFNAYVNGEKTTLNVRYDALDGNTGDYEPNKAETPLKEGILYQVKKTIDEEYIVDVEQYAAKTDGKTVETVGADAFWLTVADGETYKQNQWDVNDKTVFVVVDYKANGDVDSIYEGKLKHMDDEDYDITVCVVKHDEQTAELVYIFRTPVAEKSDDASIKSVTVRGVDVVNGVANISYTNATTALSGKVHNVDVVRGNDKATVKVYFDTAADGKFTQDWTAAAESQAAVADWTTNWTDFFLKIVVTSEDKTKTESVIVNVKTADAEVAVNLDKAASATAVDIGEDTLTVTLAEGATVKVGELKAVLKITGAANGFDIVKDAALGGTVSAADTDVVASGMKIVAESAETGADVEWTITVATGA